MAFVAQVEITVLRLEGFGSLRESVGGCFVLARIGTKLYGRSRRISDGAESFDLTLEPMPWRRELRVESGAELHGSIQVWQDNGDEAPTLAVERTWSVSPDDEGEVSIGTEPAVVLEVRPRFVPDLPRIAFVPRVAIGSHGATFATLVSRPSASVTITAVRGLYRPVDVQSTGMHTTSEEGYTSADHQGRVFINRDVDGSWKKGYQAIELEVKVEMLAGRLPPECGVVWTLHGEDDPLNDRLDTHREWGPVLDPGDYDSNGVPTGASGGDIRGLTPANPPWREVAPHTISSITASAVLTTIKDGVSKVRLLCPDQGGDVFSVSADLDPVPGLESFGDRTGVMTMWNRFDVEYVRIAGALSLRRWLRRVATAFEPACIQLDFAQEREANVSEDWDFWETPKAYPKIISKELFSRHQEPGWLFLAAAKEPVKAEAKGAGSLPESRVSTLVQLTRAGHSSYLGFVVKTGVLPKSVDHYVVHHGDLRLYFREEDRHSKPFYEYCTLGHLHLARHGRADRHGAVYPYEIRRRLRADDYGVPVAEEWTPPWEQTVRIDAVPEAALSDNIAAITGVSPWNHSIGSAEYWWGVSFVHAIQPGEESNSFVGLMARDIVHEMVHGLGLHHLCGYHDVHTPRRLSCACNYDAHALWSAIDEQHDDAPTEIGRPRDLSVSGVLRGDRLCGYHIRELRRMRFHLHPGFNWRQ